MEAGVSRSDAVFSEVLKKSIGSGYAVTGISMQSVVTLCEALGASLVEDHWTFNTSKGAERQTNTDFVAGYGVHRQDDVGLETSEELRPDDRMPG